MKLILILNFVIITFLRSSYSDYERLFSSTYQLQHLFEDERKFANALRNYYVRNSADTENDRQLRDFLNKVYPDRVLNDLNSIKDVEEYVSHPINVFGISSRVAKQFWNYGIKFLLDNETSSSSSSSSSEIVRELAKYSQHFPDVKEYENACESVFLLHDVYNLNATELMDGKIWNYAGRYRPEWSEIYDIGMSACNLNIFDRGIPLLQMGMQRFDPGEYPDEIRDMKRTLQLVYKKHDAILEKYGPSSMNYRTFSTPFNKNLKAKKKKKRKESKFGKESPEIRLFSTDINKKDLKRNFYEGCKSDSLRNAEINADMKCYWIHQGNPFLKLGPYKAEIKNRKPFTYLIHDFMSEAEMKYFRENVEERLIQSTYGPSIETKIGGQFRTSKQNWIIEKIWNGSDPTNLPADYKSKTTILDPTAFKVTGKIGRAVGLHTRFLFATEAFQVANYGLGGQYDLHEDAHGYHDGKKEFSREGLEIYSKTGDRLATFMVYLSDVKEGGRTVFPFTGVSSEPVKGTAIFWFNLKYDGTTEKWSRHGACPVLIGSKWIMNKWIEYYDQFQIIPCPINGRGRSIEPHFHHF